MTCGDRAKISLKSLADGFVLLLKIYIYISVVLLSIAKVTNKGTVSTPSR
jgi:hypothetical protein